MSKEGWIGLAMGLLFLLLMATPLIWPGEGDEDR